MPVLEPSFLEELEAQGFEALVSKGVHALLFRMKKSGSSIAADLTNNLLYGYPVGGFNTSGDSPDQEEFQNQLVGGDYKNFVPGAIDPGDVTFNTYFHKEKGKPKITPIITNSTVFTPQFILMLGIYPADTPAGTTPASLDGFFAAGVNYAGGGDIKGDYGKVIGSSLKFKITGQVKIGTTDVGSIDYQLYTAHGA